MHLRAWEALGEQTPGEVGGTGPQVCSRQCNAGHFSVPACAWARTGMQYRLHPLLAKRGGQGRSFSRRGQFSPKSVRNDTSTNQGRGASDQSMRCGARWTCFSFFRRAFSFLSGGSKLACLEHCSRMTDREVVMGCVPMLHRAAVSHSSRLDPAEWRRRA